MTTGLDRVIEAINSCLNKKLEVIKLSHPDISISPSQLSVINSYRVQIIAQATQIYTIGNNAIADDVNNILNQFTHRIRETIKLTPEQIEFIIINELYPDLMAKENLVHIKDLPQKTIDQIFEIIGQESIQSVVDQIAQLDEALHDVCSFTEKLEVEVSPPSMGIVDNNIVENHSDAVATAIGASNSNEVSDFS